MLDPLTALGVAGNVLQIIGFGFQLVTDGNQIYHSGSGLLEENKTADEVAKDLESLTKRLAESQSKWAKSRGEIPLEPDEVHLRNICERCTEIAVELQLQLQKLKCQDGPKRRRLKSYNQALASIWRKDHIDLTAKRLARYQQELDTHILIGLRKSVQESDWKNSTQFASLEQQTQELTIAVLDGGSKIDSRLGEQAAVLAQIHEHTSQILSTLGTYGRRSASPAPPHELNRPLTTALHEAAQSGEILKVRQLLRSPATDVNARDQYGCRPLHVASTGEIARKLLADRNIDRDIEDDGGRTALHCAVLKRRPDVIKVLLEAGVDKSIEDDQSRTAKFYANDCPVALWLLEYGPQTAARAADHLHNTGLLQMAWLGDLEGTVFFLQQGADVNARNDWYETALTEASRRGYTEIAEMLIKAGADLELGAGKEWTPLLQGVRDNRSDIVRLLLRHGADKEAQLDNGNTALAEACSNGYFNIAEVLIEAGGDIDAVSHTQISPLKAAAKANRHRLVQMIVRRRANTEFQDTHGVTAVHSAAHRGHVESLRILLEAGANPNGTTHTGWSSLGLASIQGSYECVKLLLEHGADVNAYQTHANGYTALGEAAQYGRTRVIELLLDHGANLENCCPSGFSALSIAAHYGQDAAICVLVERGAEIDQRGFGNRDPTLEKTPLTRAAIKGFGSTVALLLDCHASVNSRDANGMTALYWAAVHGHNDVLSVLIRGGADVNAQTNDGETPLMAAAERGHVGIARKLLEANANTRLRDGRGCTAYNLAVNWNHDRAFEDLLNPAHDEHETLHQLQADSHPSEIAAYMNEIYH